VQFSILSPWALVAIFALPLIYIFTRLAPKAPKKIKFAPIFILKQIEIKESLPQYSPLWLKILRIFMVSSFIFATSAPILEPHIGTIGTNNNFLFIIDNSIANASEFSQIKQELQELINNESVKNPNVKFTILTCDNKIKPLGLDKINALPIITNLGANYEFCILNSKFSILVIMSKAILIRSFFQIFQMLRRAKLI
jgi:Aerotolerance regulator N-terminal